VREDLAVPPEALVDALRDPDRQPLHPPRERATVVGLADEVHVVRLDAEVDEPEAEAVAAGAEPFAQDVPHLVLAQRGEIGAQTEGHVAGRVPGGRRPAQVVGDGAAALATGARPVAAVLSARGEPRLHPIAATPAPPLSHLALPSPRRHLDNVQ